MIGGRRLRLALGLALALASCMHGTAQPVGSAPRSGYAFLGPELRELQDDRFAKPGELWVDRGRALFEAAPPGGASCASCHGAPTSLAGVAAAMPRWDPALRSLENLEMQINECRIDRQHQPPWPWESEELLAVSALVAAQSRGQPMAPVVDGPAARALRAGEHEFERRRGQLDLSCADCHRNNVGKRLRGDLVSEGQINGFPIYRLTWQTLGSRQRMFRWCNEAVGAEPHAFGADEYLALELYLAHRGRGLPLESPAVRR